jgi:FkbM family methyltransferase
MRSNERPAAGALPSGPFKRWLIGRVPAHLRPAARHWYRRILSRLDAEMELLAPALEPRTVAVDVGASEGDYSYYFIRHGLSVEAFEPQPASAQLLRSLRGDGIRVHPVALSDGDGTATLAIPMSGGVAESGRASLGREAIGGRDSQLLEVECRALDSYQLRGVSIIKIDAEGHEPAVLRGAEGTIAGELPILLVELELRHLGAHGWAEALDWLRSHGYRGFYSSGPGCASPLETFSHSRHQRLRDDIPLDPYVNNFIFLPPSGPRSEPRFRIVTPA